MDSNGQIRKVADLDYETIKVGDKVEFTKTINPINVDTFATLTGDFNPLHTDDEYASRTQFNERVAHGMLAGSLFSTIVGMHLPGKKCLYLSQQLSFRLPIKIGEEVKVQGEVIQKTDAHRILLIQTKVISKDNQILIDGEARVKVLEDH